MDRSNEGNEDSERERLALVNAQLQQFGYSELVARHGNAIVPASVVEQPLPALERTILPAPTLTEASKQLGREAAELLGYKVIAARSAQEHVLEVFKKLGFEPLDEQKVLEYQKARQQRENARLQELSRVRGWHQGSAQWTSAELSKYSLPVPEFVLSRCIELKREIPEAQFFVEFMIYVRNDPFVRMLVGSGSYYLDVWEEPEFEGRRVV